MSFLHREILSEPPHAKQALRIAAAAAASGWRPDSNRQTVAAAFVCILRCLRQADNRMQEEGFRERGSRAGPCDGAAFRRCCCWPR